MTVDIPKDGEATTEQVLPHIAYIREQAADGQAGPRHSNRTTQHPVRLGSSTVSVKRIKPNPKMGGKCSCEDKKKLADFEEKVCALEKIISDHTRKMSHLIQITHGRYNQSNVHNTHQQWRSLNKHQTKE